MQNQGSTFAQVMKGGWLMYESRLQETAKDSVGELQSSRPETETSSRTASSNLADSRATHPASQNQHSECTAAPTNPENGEDTVPKTVNLLTFEDRIATLESRLPVVHRTIAEIESHLARLECKLQTYMATSDKTLADRVQRLEQESLRSMQNQMDTRQAASTDSVAPSSIPASQSAHCSEKLSTQSTDQARAKTSSRRDISWEEFDREYTSILATVRAVAASKQDSRYAAAWFAYLRNRLESLTDNS